MPIDPAHRARTERRQALGRARAVTVALTAAVCAALAGCSSTTQGAVAGNTRLNETSAPPASSIDSTSVLTPQSSPQQPSAGSTPGATAVLAPSPDADQATALRSVLQTIDGSLDTDAAAQRAVTVCTTILAGSDQPTIAGVVRQQFGAALPDTTVIAVQNAITGSFCHR